MKIKKTCVIFLSTLLTTFFTFPVYAELNKHPNMVYDERTMDLGEIELEPMNSIKYYSSPYMDIAYSYTSEVSSGTVRYISQLRRSKYFDSDYWGRWDGSESIKCANGSWYGGPGQECFTSCISMALSYVGVNKTPADILEFGGGITIVNTSWGGATYMNSSFEEAFEKFKGGNGTYSPPIIHLDNYSSGGHYVLVIGQSAENVYQVLDPARDVVWDITFNGNTVTYTVENGSSRSDTVSSAHQYYMKDTQLVRPFISYIDSPTKSELYNDVITVRGWALYGKGITKVCAMINGHSFEIPLVPRLDVANAHPGYPTGNEGYDGIIPMEYLKNGSNTLELFAFSGLDKFNIGSVGFSFKNIILPEISDVEIVQDNEGATITCKVSDDYGIDRVQFPTWTYNNGQDDIAPEWSVSESVSGQLVDGTVTYRVNRSEHNNEDGVYITHIYAYDIHGNYSAYKLEYEFKDKAITVSAVSASISEGKYTIQCVATDEDGIDHAEFETYRYSDGIYELCSGGIMENMAGEDIYTGQFEIGEEVGSCYYRTYIYVYDIYGNTTKDSFVVYYNNEQTEINPDISEIFKENTYLLFDIDSISMTEIEEFCNSNGGNIVDSESEEATEFFELFKEYSKENVIICKIPLTGECGESLKYSISEDYVLTVSGTGEMYDWSDEDLTPWCYYTDKIRKVALEEGVTSVGAYAFSDCINLGEVSFSPDVTNIGEKSFSGVFSFESMVIPKTVSSIEEGAFDNCPLLKNITILGKNTVISENKLISDVLIKGYSDTPAETFAAEYSYNFRSLSGQLNDDGVIDASDALLILKHAASLVKVTDEIRLDAADMNNDLLVDAADALIVLKIAAGIID